MQNMNAKLRRGCLVLVGALILASCGGGGGSPAVTVPMLISIALSPLSASLAPGGTQQVTVTGTNSDNTTQVLPASGETFESSNTAVATVSAAGLISVAADASVGSTATISATDTASGLMSSTANSTVVTVSSAASGPPTATSVTAATATAADNAMCSAITPFYWEIGDKSTALASASIGTPLVVSSTRVSIASASKWIYGTYVVQLRGSAAKLTAQDITFMNFTSGYNNMPTDITGSACPAPASGPNTVNVCLEQTDPSNGLPYTYQDPATVGAFDYGSAHLENHASLYGGLGDIPVGTLGSTIAGLLDPSGNFLYTEPLMAGGIFTSSNDYVLVLRGILSGVLFMRDALGTNPVCTRPSAPNCNAVFSPIPEAWHYSIAHWVEDDPTTHGDGAFSSAGAYGFYPWIEASKAYYGIISRQTTAVGSGEQAGYASAQCGRLIRHAWDTGVEQAGAIPD
jgi:hypothetical protein